MSLPSSSLTSCSNTTTTTTTAAGAADASTNSSSNNNSDDEVMRKLLKPNPTKDEVIDLLERKYFSCRTTGSKSTTKIEMVRELDSYDDRNYLIKKITTTNRTDSGGSSTTTQYLLVKIHNGVESTNLIDALERNKKQNGYYCSVIQLQHCIMEMLNDHGICTSEPQRPFHDDDDDNNDNDSISFGIIEPLSVASKDHSPCRLVIRVLSWIEGKTLSSYPIFPIECLADVGRYLGYMNCIFDTQMNSQTIEDRYEPAATRYHQWDGKRVLDIRSFVHLFDNPHRQQLILSILQSFQTEIVDNPDIQFREGFNHSDFNDANILVHTSSTGALFPHVCGVIDFGDSVYSWRVLDIAVAMAYGMMSSYGKRGHAIAAAAAILRGYHSIYPLTCTERKYLPLLIACRLATSVTLGAYSYQQSNPKNEYLLFHAEPGWKTLQLLWNIDQQERSKTMKAIHRVFDQACEGAYNSSSNNNNNNNNDNDNDKKTIPIIRNDDPKEIIDCSDISMPDPNTIDLLSSVRQQQQQ